MQCLKPTTFATGAASEKWHTTGLKCLSGPMSALGHKRTYAVQNVMSALPPKAGHLLRRLNCQLRVEADISASGTLMRLANPIRPSE